MRLVFHASTRASDRIEGNVIHPNRESFVDAFDSVSPTAASAETHFPFHASFPPFLFSITPVFSSGQGEEYWEEGGRGEWGEGE